MILVISDVLDVILDLTASEELLSIRSVVQDNTESSGHVDSLVLAVEVDVLLGVGATVAVDVLKFVGLVGALVVLLIVVIWLNDLSEPGTDGHLRLALFLVDLKEIAFRASFIFATIAGDRLAGVLVVANTVAIVHVDVVVEHIRRRSAR